MTLTNSMESRPHSSVRSFGMPARCEVDAFFGSRCRRLQTMTALHTRYLAGPSSSLVRFIVCAQRFARPYGVIRMATWSSRPRTPHQPRHRTEQLLVRQCVRDPRDQRTPHYTSDHDRHVKYQSSCSFTGCLLVRADAQKLPTGSGADAYRWRFLEEPVVRRILRRNFRSRTYRNGE